jgi:selenocysteine lyase/cysteine desulfurase
MPLIKENTHTVICNLLSNVTGEEPNISALSEICRREGLTFIADASQKIGHSSIDVKKIGCDILCAPAHKALFGVQGAGFAVIYNDKLIRTFCEGGSGSESKKPSMPQYLPERFEAGTLPTPSIAALGAGIEFINSVGVEAIDRKIKLLTAALFDRLSERSYISYLSGANGVISFTVKGISPSRISELLDSYGICVRSGLHCAPLVHIREGTDKEGCVRVSFSYFNKLHEIDDFITTLDKIAKAYK